ncbi:hypothetical protein F5B20DRAFT_581268 [Whalleya microplaca]|nr:hypothetical protein F5B20DRAFT_581268 [Whalleya microplaca]
MRRKTCLLLSMLYQSIQALNTQPASTTISAGVDSRPSPTPTVPPLANLELRDRNPLLCGFWDGYSGLPYLCATNGICSWDDSRSAIGCVGTAPNNGMVTQSVPTTCLDYADYMNGACDGMGLGTLCCDYSQYPKCLTNTYHGSPADDYSMILCARTDVNARALAWDATTSGASTVTVPTPDARPMYITNINNTSAPQSADQHSGLSNSDKITLGTALGIGLPATIGTIIGTWIAVRQWRKRKQAALSETEDQHSLLAKNQKTPHEVSELSV